MYPQQQVFWHIEHCASDSEINQIAGCQLTNQGTSKLVIDWSAGLKRLSCLYMDPAGMTWHGPVRYYQRYPLSVKRCAICITPGHMSEKAYSSRWICNHMRWLTRPLWYNVCWCLGPFLSPDVAGPWLSLCRVLNRAFSAPLTRNKYQVWDWYREGINGLRASRWRVLAHWSTPDLCHICLVKCVADLIPVEKQDKNSPI